MNAKIESIEAAEAALDEVAEFIGNRWPEHVVDENVLEVEGGRDGVVAYEIQNELH